MVRAGEMADSWDKMCIRDRRIAYLDVQLPGFVHLAADLGDTALPVAFLDVYKRQVVDVLLAARTLGRKGDVHIVPVPAVGQPVAHRVGGLPVSYTHLRKHQFDFSLQQFRMGNKR